MAGTKMSTVHDPYQDVNDNMLIPYGTRRLIAYISLIRAIRIKICVILIINEQSEFK